VPQPRVFGFRNVLSTNPLVDRAPFSTSVFAPFVISLAVAFTIHPLGQGAWLAARNAPTPRLACFRRRTPRLRSTCDPLWRSRLVTVRIGFLRQRKFRGDDFRARRFVLDQLSGALPAEKYGERPLKRSFTNESAGHPYARRSRCLQYFDTRVSFGKCANDPARTTCENKRSVVGNARLRDVMPAD